MADKKIPKERDKRKTFAKLKGLFKKEDEEEESEQTFEIGAPINVVHQGHVGIKAGYLDVS